MIDKIAKILDEFAPLSGADTPWDNVGILIRGEDTNKSILLTIDLTLDVVKEAKESNIQNIISYHPVIFRGVKQIGEKERVIRQCILNNISVLCPHTSLDRKMNEHIINFFNEGDPVKFNKLTATSRNYSSIVDAVDFLKEMCNLKFVRVVLGCNHSLESVPTHISVGVGSSFKDIDFTDHLIITGEMSHHNMLDAKYSNCSIVLLEHSNSERLFLKVLKELYEDYEISIARTDVDPVQII